MMRPVWTSSNQQTLHQFLFLNVFIQFGPVYNPFSTVEETPSFLHNSPTGRAVRPLLVFRTIHSALRRYAQILVPKTGDVGSGNQVSMVVSKS